MSGASSSRDINRKTNAFVFFGLWIRPRSRTTVKLIFFKRTIDIFKRVCVQSRPVSSRSKPGTEEEGRFVGFSSTRGIGAMRGRRWTAGFSSGRAVLHKESDKTCHLPQIEGEVEGGVTAAFDTHLAGCLCTQLCHFTTTTKDRMSGSLFLSGSLRGAVRARRIALLLLVLMAFSR